MDEPIVCEKAARFIPVAKPSVTRAEREAVDRALRESQLSMGRQVREFERRFADAHGRKHGVSCNSGASALMLALRGMGVGAGSVVAMPTMTMVACANAALSLGARPVFVDSESETGNADWSKPPEADVYMVVHLYGACCEFSQLPRAKVLEDCAECHFSAGRMGRMAAFSFYANKCIACGEGGMVLTDDDEAAERMGSLRAHAFTSGTHFHHSEHAWGLRMTELQGALGCAQLDRWPEMADARRSIAEMYQERLSHIWWLESPLRPPGSAWWVYPVLIRKHRSAPKLGDVRAALAREGVQTRSYFKPLHAQPFLREYAGKRYPVADELYARGFYLPLWVGMGYDDVEYIADVLGAL